MVKGLVCLNNLAPQFATPIHPSHHGMIIGTPSFLRSHTQQKQPTTHVFAAKSGGFSFNSLLNRCQTCQGKGAIDCPGCKGSGKNKKNGNIFERWKCYDCQGFGLKSCPNCGQGGLTPEQRGER